MLVVLLSRGGDAHLASVRLILTKPFAMAGRRLKGAGAATACAAPAGAALRCRPRIGRPAQPRPRAPLRLQCRDGEPAGSGRGASGVARAAFPGCARCTARAWRGTCRERGKRLRLRARGAARGAARGHGGAGLRPVGCTAADSAALPPRRVSLHEAAQRGGTSRSALARRRSQHRRGCCGGAGRCAGTRRPPDAARRVVYGLDGAVAMRRGVRRRRVAPEATPTAAYPGAPDSLPSGAHGSTCCDV